jgi:hypothetical protein
MGGEVNVTAHGYLTSAGQQLGTGDGVTLPHTTRQLIGTKGFPVDSRRALISGCPIAATRNEGDRSMPLLNVVVMLIIVGVGLYLINRYIPMASSIKSILNVVVVVVVCVWLLQAVGMWGDVRNFRLTR